MIQELQVMKVKEAGGTKCLVLTLNSSDNAVPQAVLNATEPVSVISVQLVFLFLCAVLLNVSALICMAYCT